MGEPDILPTYWKCPAGSLQGRFSAMDACAVAAAVRSHVSAYMQRFKATLYSLSSAHTVAKSAETI